MRLLLFACVLVIFALGLMMVFNTSSALVLDRSLQISPQYALIKQLLFALIGLFFSWGIWCVGYDNLLKLSMPLFLVGIVLLLLVFIPGVGVLRNGARRWVALGPISFQPSELMKFISPMVLIHLVFKQKQKQVSLWTFLKIAALLFVPICLVMIEPDNGTAAVMGVSLLPLFFLLKVPFKYWALPVCCTLLVGAVVAYNVPYVRARLKVYRDPTLDLKGKGHQPYQAKIAAGSGGLFGRGAGGSLQKLTYLPEAQNDYIAAIFAEEFGFLGISALVTLYTLFGLAGYAIAMRAKDKEGLCLAAFITFLISLQAFLNLGVVSGLLPSKGVNLPFFSQGGTSLIANIIACTVLVNIANKAERRSGKEKSCY